MEMKNLLLHSWVTATYLLWHLFFSPVLGVQREGRGKGRIERIDGGFSKFPINVRFKPFGVIRSRTVSCHFFLLFVLSLQPGKIKKIKLQLWRASLLSFFVLLSSYLAVLSCPGTVTLYSIQRVSGNPK